MKRCYVAVKNMPLIIAVSNVITQINGKNLTVQKGV